MEEPEFVNKVFGWYRAYTDGYLPFRGALTDQPNVLVEAFEQISLVKGLLDAEDVDKAEAGNKDADLEQGGFKRIASSRD